MKHTISILFLLTSLLLAPAVAVHAAGSDNLLINGGAEAGDLSGWTDQEAEETGDGTFSAKTEYLWGGDDIYPQEGDYFFFAGATPGNRIYQDVNVEAYPEGTVFTLSGYMNGWKTDHGDNSYLEMDFLDRRGRSLAADSVCEPSIAGWDFYSFRLEKPAGAVSVRVSLIAERNTGSDCDSYFDDITLTAKVPDTPAGTAPARPSEPARPSGSSAGGVQDVSDFEIIWSNFNTDAVRNGAPVQITLNVEDSVLIQAATTYHWNKGMGQRPGSISFWENGEEIGSWEAVGRAGSGAENVNWDIFPDILLEAGHTYEVTDSSPATWSCNGGSNNEGFLELRGYFISDEEPAEPAEPNYELSYGDSVIPSDYINPVLIACDPERGELMISYTNEKDHFGTFDIEDADQYSGEQRTILYRKDSSGHWRKLSRITTVITAAEDPRSGAGSFGTIRLQFLRRGKEMDLSDDEYAVRFGIYTNGYHMTPEDGEPLELATLPGIDEILAAAQTVQVQDTEAAEAYSPASYAVSGGSWDILESGEKVYYKKDGSEARNEWVEDGGKYYFIDHSGCLMRDSWSSDGFRVDKDGAWIESIPMRTDDPEPMTGVRYGEDPYWTFEIPGRSGSGQYGTAVKTYSFGSSETYTMTPIGHGGYLLEYEKSPDIRLQLSVSEDRESIIVCGSGLTDEYAVQ